PKPHLAAELFEKMGKPGWALRNRLAHSGKNRSFYKTPQGGIAVLSENAGKKAEARGWKKLSITQVWAMLGRK
ncbi:MAG: hypothetical protein Q7R70_03650, partial [Candidatus Diapherotrites archaeon]|nr:hypothetical protein [Candidatus Diapherotrites archaeon]